MKLLYKSDNAETSWKVGARNLMIFYSIRLLLLLLALRDLMWVLLVKLQLFFEFLLSQDRKSKFKLIFSFNKCQFLVRKLKLWDLYNSK